MFLFLDNPFYAVISGIIYVLIVFLMVRKEKKYLKYGVTILFSILHLSFLYLWFDKIVYLMTSSNLELSTYNNFLRFVNVSYFVLLVPLLFVFAWYGIKKILSQDQYLWLKSIFTIVYISALIATLILGELVFVILYYGFAP